MQTLQPQIVVASHRRADAPNDALGLTEAVAYFGQTDRLLARRRTAADFGEQMLISHPTRLNASTVLYGAAALGLS
ncbi:hypothetical protein [Mycolicibacterium cosmeticum]|uniref:hypothetical protein n=1 Tax=Mycolicibacterium cosmeticum TaxID=258533 RepID=UPI0032047369